MIASSRMVQAFAVCVSLAVHGGATLTLVAPAPVRTEGGPGTAEMRLGSSFADMAAGRAMPVRSTVAPADPARLVSAVPVAPEAAATRPLIDASGPAPARRAQPSVSEGAGATVPAEPDRAAVAQSPRVARHIAPRDPARGAPAEPAAAAPIPRVTATDPESTAVDRSLRPLARPPQPPVRRATTQPAPEGGARADARAGASSGQAEATARSRGDGSAPGASGTADAANYPGLVLRALSGVKPPRTGLRGTAVVTFTIAQGGGLAGVGIARSSGSVALDRMAVRLVRDAAPFPAPPQGARRSFDISIEGR